jgi:hypothetical protein
MLRFLGRGSYVSQNDQRYVVILIVSITYTKFVNKKIIERRLFILNVQCLGHIRAHKPEGCR